MQSMGRAPSKEQIINYLENGFTQAEVARLHGVSRQTINKKLRHEDHGEPYETPYRGLIRLLNNTITGIELKHKESSGYKRLTNHLEFVATEGRHMSKAKLKALGHWYKNLIDTNTVLMFDPTIPPRPYSKNGGWEYVPRQEKDKDLLIRVNQYVDMTPEAKEVLRMPKESHDIIPGGMNDKRRS